MEPRDLARQAIERVTEDIRWKPNKDVQHLERRIVRGHLADGATLEQYEAIIQRVVRDLQAEVYLFEWGDTFYPSVVAYIDGKPWLVMVDEAGIMETAFLIDEDRYLDDPRFRRLGTLQEVTS